jgi:hypothetical protein
MARANGSEALHLLVGEIKADVRHIMLAVETLRGEVSDVRDDLSTMKARPTGRKSRLPSWRTIRYLSAAAFTLAAAISRLDGEWAGHVIRALTR